MNETLVGIRDFIAEHATDEEPQKGRKPRKQKTPASMLPGITLTKPLPAVADVMKLMSTATPGVWFSPVPGLELLIPANLSLQFKTAAGRWTIHNGQDILLKIRVGKDIAGIPLKYNTSLRQLQVTAKQIVFVLDYFPDITLNYA